MSLHTPVTTSNSKFISHSSAELFYLQEGIEPMWEDARNRQGGRWLVNTQKNFRQHELDRLWLETVRSLLLLLHHISYFSNTEILCEPVFRVIFLFVYTFFSKLISIYNHC